MVRYFLVNTDRKGLEETKCYELHEAVGTIEYAIMKGATNLALFVRYEASPALAAERERACLPNAEVRQGE